MIKKSLEKQKEKKLQQMNRISERTLYKKKIKQFDL
jgi:hypothetical protein